MPDETRNYLINFETSATRAGQEITALSTAVQNILPATTVAAGGFRLLTAEIAAAGIVQDQEIARKELMVIVLNNVAGAAITAGTGIAFLTAQIVQAQQLTSGQPLLLTGPTGAQPGQPGIDYGDWNIPGGGGAGGGPGGGEPGGDEPGGGGRRGGWLGRYAARYLVRYFLVWQAMRGAQQIIRDWTQAHEDLDRTLFRLQTTMGMTTTEAERYMSTMRQMGGGIGIPGAQLAGGAMQLGQAGAGMAGQFGVMTGLGAGPGMEFFAGIQRQYQLTNAQIEQLIPRMFAAFARSGQDIQSFMGDWEEMLRQFDAGSIAVTEWTRALEIYETTGMRASERLSGAWQDFLSVMGDTQPIIDFKNRIADLLQVFTRDIEFGGKPPEEQERLLREYYEATGRTGGMPAYGLGPSYHVLTPGFNQWLQQQEGATPTGGPITTAHEQWRLTGIAPGVREEQFGIKGFAGRMTGAEAERYEELIQKWDAYFLEQGRYLEKQTITLVTEIGQPLKEIQGSAYASKMALEEMNERQKTAVYNWPGNVAMIAMGVEAATGGATAIRRDAPAPPPYIPFGSTVPYIPGTPYQPSGLPTYQRGGVVQETGPAIVHRGEVVSPAGGFGNVNVNSHLYVDGRLVAKDVSQIQGNQLMQAQRATAGLPGAIASM